MSRLNETPARTRRSPLGRLVTSFLSLSLLASLFAVATLSSPQAAKSPTVTDQYELVSCIGYCSYPRNAGKVFRWGREKWRDEFETGAFPSTWKAHQRKLIGMQHGMFTIKAPSRIQKMVTWREGHKAAYGRWEARVRAVELSAGRQFNFTWELVPFTRDRCNDNRIVLASYTPGDKVVRGMVRSAKSGKKFTFAKPLDLRSRAWHAYAVEVTKTHISWFVDTRVVRTERRPAALSGTKWIPQFRIEAAQAGGNRSSWLQMDWVRHYTLDRPNAKSINAPRMQMSDFKPTCG